MLEWGRVQADSECRVIGRALNGALIWETAGTLTGYGSTCKYWIESSGGKLFGEFEKSFSNKAHSEELLKVRASAH